MQNLFSIGRIAKRLLPIACLLLVLTGCESMRTVMTQHKVEMVVESIPSSEGRYFFVPSSPAFPFEHPGYEDSDIRIVISTTLWALNFRLESKDSTDTLLRWDEARYGESENALQPFKIIRRYRKHGEEKDISVKPVASVLTAVEDQIGIYPDYQLIFDSPYAFGTQPLQQGQGFIDDGVGRSMILELPIEYDGHRVIYRFTFTATDVQQWNSYH